MKRLLPAYPLFVKDPYYSIWAQTEKLNEKDVIFWTGAEKRLLGYIKTEGKVYSFLGKDERFEKAEQLDLSVTAFTTDYLFNAGNAQLKLSFVSPVPPNHLRLMSCPVCYLKYEVTGVKSAEIVLAVGQNVCYNGEKLREVRGGAVRMDGYQTAFFGLKRQMPLSDDSDRFGADWGYWYLSGERAYYTDIKGLDCYFNGEEFHPSVNEGSEKFLLSCSSARSGKIMLAFDDTVSVRYFGEFLKGFYLEGNTIFQALDETFTHFDEIDSFLSGFDAELLNRSSAYGKEYYDVLCASLRQSVAAHKLVKDKSGELLFFSKECYSNGCMGTVDVSYPSMPLYLLFNPELIKAMLRPVFRFAAMPVWKYDFAPHDVGAYPNCCGQVYGLRGDKDAFLGDMLAISETQTRFPIWQLPAAAEIYDFKYQMPVEECANVIIMLAAATAEDGNLNFVEREWETLKKWVDYLVKYGLKPETQLCTDDFSGHLKNNLNLAIKSTVGIGCYAELCKALKFESEYKIYRNTAKKFAAEIVKFSNSFGHSPLTWDAGGETYSLKYNLAFDKILGLNLFPSDFCESEVNYYLTQKNAYGIPLDNRAEFTKSDWLMWTAALTDDWNKRRKIIGGLYKYLTESEDRLPFGDWYDTKTGRLIGFRNRTVQGGCFILLMDDKEKNDDVNEPLALKLKPVLKDYLWGGMKLKKMFGRDNGGNAIAESWEVSVHPDGMSKYNGSTLAEYLRRNPYSVDNDGNAFPVLIKYIDAKQNLSVQVHPDDAYARRVEDDNGKTEMWYVLQAEKGAGIYCGFKAQTSPEEFVAKVKDGTVEELLNFVPVKEGDCFLIEAGTVHAIGAGCVICEVQQSSNVTYRVYDYNRKDALGNTRQLHLEKAMDVINFKAFRDVTASGKFRATDGGKIRLLTRCKYFRCRELLLDGKFSEKAEKSFIALNMLEGKGTVNGREFVCGESFFIPCGEQFTVSGKAKIMITDEG